MYSFEDASDGCFFGFVVDVEADFYEHVEIGFVDVLFFWCVFVASSEEDQVDEADDFVAGQVAADLYGEGVEVAFYMFFCVDWGAAVGGPGDYSIGNDFDESF